MKNILKITIFALMAIGMLACGGNEKKITQKDLKKAELTLFNDDMSMNEKLAPNVAEKYCQFVQQNPDDSTSSMWLFHAMEIYVTLKDTEKSIELCDQLVENYPDSRWAPRSLFLLANFIYDSELHDLDKARATYEQLINDYPDDELVDDAKKSIEYLGLTPEEIMSLYIMSQMEED